MSKILPSPEPLTLTYDQTAALLGISPRSVWSLVAGHELKAIRIGRAVRIPRAEIDRFIEERQDTRQPA